ncbi:MAG: diphthine--ammonia ligase [Candidatus Woesearchaeota archaeon]
MKLGILLSGGKDSVYAAYLAAQEHEIACAITIESENKESYMFHTPNINVTALQAEAMGVPHVVVTTKGEKEKELEELDEAIAEAKEKHGIEGVVTGAVASQYQGSRVQQLCDNHDLWCFNPLWQINQMQLLRELQEHQFEVVIAGVFAYPFRREMLGKVIDENIMTQLKEYEKEYKINPAGEGGEIETFVTDCPLFRKRITIAKTSLEYDNYAGTYTIIDAKLEGKDEQEIKTLKREETHTAEHPEVTIIDSTDQTLPILHYEFIKPIVEALKENYVSFEIVPLSEAGAETIKGKKIIMSGTALKDNSFMKYDKQAKIIVENGKPVLGICAGMELIVRTEGIELDKISELGPVKVSTVKDHELVTGLDATQHYFMHKYGVSKNRNTTLIQLLVTDKAMALVKLKDKPIYGVQFHPELGDKSLLLKFIDEIEE